MLAEIVANTRRAVAARATLRSAESLRAHATPTTTSFSAALKSARPALILEFKRAAPSAGALRPQADLDAVARAYAPFAAAVSVLTDSRYFGGSHGDLAALRLRLDQPLLCKDFFVSPYQVYEARVHGADAVLLMLAVLDDAGYRACAEAAARLGMEVLSEVHDERELGRALALGARIIGINNRDLTTLGVDLATTARLAPRIPEGVLRVAESGIGSRRDLARVAPAVDAVLIGSALMRAPRIDLALRALACGRAKVCGLTDAADARAAYAAGATFAGINLCRSSPRGVDLASAAVIAAASPLLPVGVFVDASLDEVAAAVHRLGLHAAQLHGDEDAAYLAALRRRIPAAVELWKAVAVGGDIPTALPPGADRLLLDTAHATLRGGTGRAFDWALLDDLAEPERHLLAGGIGPANAAHAERRGLHAIDLCSGVEAAPGRKDRAALAALFDALRRAPAEQVSR